VPQRVVADRTRSPNDQKDGHVDQERQHARQPNEEHVGLVKLILPDARRRRRSPVVKQWHKRHDKECRHGRSVQLQLQRGAVEGPLEGTGPNLIEWGDEDTRHRKRRADSVEPKVGRRRKDDTEADGHQGQAEGRLEHLGISQRLNDHNRRRRHHLHHLVKADAVVLQAEVGENDKAHGAGRELGRLLERQRLFLKDPNRRRH